MKNKGFTLIEILLVVALIAILAGIVILAINPSKQLADTRNAQRRLDVKTIIDAVYQYMVDNNGTVPSGIATSSTCPGAVSTVSEICSTGSVNPSCVDLSVLTNSSKYIVSMPFDPTGQSASGVGYNIVKTSDKRLIVCAPDAENSATIEITR